MNSSLEERRLAALHELAVLDTEAEPEFDEIVHLAAAICDAPISVVSLVDKDRQWFKASVGVGCTETPRSLAFCDHTIRQPDLLIVEDATADSRFDTHPMVTGEEHWRFYAGFPVTSPDGHSVGALCVLDQQPRRLAEAQKTALRLLAGHATSRLELRLKRQQLEQALRETEQQRAVAFALQQRFQQFMDNSPFLSYMKDSDGCMVYYNQPLATRFHVGMTDMLGKTDDELWSPDEAAAFRANDLQVLQSGKLQVTLERAVNPDGSSSTWNSYKFPVQDEHGKTLLGGVSVDVTEQLQRQQELEQLHKELQQANLLLQQLASTDALTGLFVRRVFDDALRQRFSECHAAGTPVCALLLDVDDFKRHNDQHGHPHGDRVLQALGTSLRNSLCIGDLVARYGGEEFAVLLGSEAASEIPAIVERLLAGIRTLNVDGTSITASIGICAADTDTLTVKELMANADAALFTAKRQGKNRAVFYDEKFRLFCPLPEVQPFLSSGLAAVPERYTAMRSR